MMKKIKFKFSKNGAQKLILIVLKYRYLFFFLFFSAFLAFTFKFLYEYIYIGANFSEYEESYESKVMLDVKTNNRTLKEILKNIEWRNEALKKDRADYNNPFEFIDSGIPKTNEVDNIGNHINNNENNSLISPSLPNTSNIGF